MRRRITALAATLMLGAVAGIVATPAHAAGDPTPSWRICPPKCVGS